MKRVATFSFGGSEQGVKRETRNLSKVRAAPGFVSLVQCVAYPTAQGIVHRCPTRRIAALSVLTLFRIQPELAPAGSATAARERDSHLCQSPAPFQTPFVLVLAYLSATGTRVLLHRSNPNIARLKETPASRVSRAAAMLRTMNNLR